MLPKAGTVPRVMPWSCSFGGVGCSLHPVSSNTANRWCSYSRLLQVPSQNATQAFCSLGCDFRILLLLLLLGSCCKQHSFYLNFSEQNKPVGLLGCAQSSCQRGFISPVWPFYKVWDRGNKLDKEKFQALHHLFVLLWKKKKPKDLETIFSRAARKKINN